MSDAPTVRLARSDETALAVVRRSARAGELPRVVPAACGAVWNALRARAVTGAGCNVALYLDASDGVIRLEVGVEYGGPLDARDDGLVRSALPAGAVATLTHFGPYGGLGRAHAAIVAWCHQHGHVLAGPNWEVYGHWVDAWNHDPSAIRTDVFYLLANAPP